jgi:hypothetical protein
MAIWPYEQRKYALTKGYYNDFSFDGVYYNLDKEMRLIMEAPFSEEQLARAKEIIERSEERRLADLHQPDMHQFDGREILSERSSQLTISASRDVVTFRLPSTAAEFRCRRSNLYGEELRNIPRTVSSQPGPGVGEFSQESIFRAKPPLRRRNTLVSCIEAYPLLWSPVASDRSAPHADAGGARTRLFGRYGLAKSALVSVNSKRQFNSA